jgi:hypothetical protein
MRGICWEWSASPRASASHCAASESTLTVEDSYTQAKAKEAEQRAARRARKLANERPREEPGSS